MKSHGGYYGCNLCCQKAESYRYRNQRGQKRIWPSETDDGTPRTHEGILEYLDASPRDNNHLQAPGILGRTPLYGLPNFDTVTGVVLDPMHFAILGIAKLLAL